MAEHSLYPFLQRFQTEQDCIESLFQVKWPAGFICPLCEHSEAYTIHTRRLPLYECMKCGHQTSLTVGTVMEGSKTTLHKWFITLFLFSRISSGISALQLSKKINVTYKTAWLMLQKIRYAMSQADANVKLCGFVQVNDVWFGHTRHSSWQRHPREYPLLIGASLTDSNKLVYVKIKLVADKYLRDRSILRWAGDDFINRHAEENTSKVDFVVGRGISTKYKKLYPIFKQMNRWIRTTFHGVSERYLPIYMNEFCYRLNACQQNPNVFQQLALLCANSRSICYADLIY